jgi:membrane-bound lytic murein transglycosylase A
VPVAASRLPPLADDLDLASLRVAIDRTVPVYERDGRAGIARAAHDLVRALESVDDPAARPFALTSRFRALRVREPVLVTSYYEPEIAVSARRADGYRYPIYRRPPDLTTPYRSRVEIDAGALDGRGLELAWTNDPLALFFVHVQGSARARFPDGRVRALRFAGTNGLPYRSLAAILIAHGLLPRDQASMFAVRRVFAGLSLSERFAYMAENPRYIFFSLADDGRGPVGSLGVELTPGRSIATDPDLVPPGTIGYLVTPTIRRFVVAQDTGAAIRGAHADLFAGAGAAAEQFAGREKERGTLYVLAPL